MDGLGMLLLLALLGLIPAVIAHRKGHAFYVWWVFGALLFVAALPAALIVKPSANHTRRPADQAASRSWETPAG